MNAIPAPPVLAHVARWIAPGISPLRAAILAEAFGDLGILEQPLGSNRGAEIDRMNLDGGSPLGSYWCANALGQWWRTAGAHVPRPGRCGSCDEWVAMAKRLGTWHAKGSGYRPLPADAVVYGKEGDANHIGCIVRAEQVLLSIEGNTHFGGHTRDGITVAMKEAHLPAVLGYVVPKPLAL